jgi:hypothetical protein
MYTQSQNIGKPIHVIQKFLGVRLETQSGLTGCQNRLRLFIPEGKSQNMLWFGSTQTPALESKTVPNTSIQLSSMCTKLQNIMEKRGELKIGNKLISCTMRDKI